MLGPAQEALVRLVLSISACAIVCSAAVAAADGPEGLSQRIVSALDAGTAECPIETQAYAASRILTCLKATMGPSQVKELVNGAVAGSGAKPRGEWRKSDDAVRGFFDFPTTMLAVEYFTSSKRIVVSYPKSLPYCAAESPAVETADFERPHVIRESQQPAQYPAIARFTRIDATIALKAIVQTDGTLRDLCVMPAQWSGSARVRARRLRVGQVVAVRPRRRAVVSRSKRRSR
jgi:hypothetical protein